MQSCAKYACTQATVTLLPNSSILCSDGFNRNHAAHFRWRNHPHACSILKAHAFTATTLMSPGAALQAESVRCLQNCVDCVILILLLSLQRMPRPSDAALQAAMAARQQAQPQSPRTPQALPPGRQATYASQLQPQVWFAERWLSESYRTVSPSMLARAGLSAVVLGNLVMSSATFGSGAVTQHA